MSQTKAQLIQPIGIVTAGGVVVTGVVTASSFDGDVVGTATSIISGGNLNLGIVTAVGTGVTASGFSGDFTGTATGIHTGADIKVGSFTATSFTGDFTGTATSMMRGTGFKAGAVNATGFHVSGTSAGTIAGNVTGDVTGDVTGVSTGNVTGNVTGNITGYAKSVTSGANIHVGVLTAITFSGDGSNLTGIAATNYNTQVVPDNKTFSINVTSPAGGNYTLSGTDRSGTVSGSSDPAVTVEIGDTLNFVVDASGHPFYIRVSDGGANVSTPAATNQGAQSGTVSWTPNTAGTYYYQCGNHAGMLGTITVTATTTIDLSAGNMITFNQSANTTISFANTSTAMDVTIIRIKDSNATPRTITWPDSVKWDGGTAPTLISKSVSGDSQQFQLITRDSGLTWYGWEPYNRDVVTYTAFGWSTAGTGSLGQNNTTNYSSPIQLGAAGNWKQVDAAGTNRSALLDSSNNLWVMGDNQYGGLGQNQPVGSHVSSPIQIPGTWSVVTQGSMGGQAIKDDGTLWTWGLNDHGNLAQNDRTSLSSPTQVGTDTTWSANINHLAQTSNTDALAIKTDGTLWMWGRNNAGGSGQNDRTSRSSPTQVGTDTDWQMATFGGETGGNCFAIKTDGTLWSWGYESYGYLGLNTITQRSSPTQIGTDTNWADVGGGGYASCATKTDGTLWSWGSNAFGELGANFTGNGSMGNNARSSPTQIPGTTWLRPWSGRHMMGCLKTDGTWWGWGSNYYGGLGLNQTGSPQRYSSPVQLPGTWATARETIVARKHNGAWSMKE